MDSNENHFNVSLIVRDKVTRQCPQTTTFEEKGELKWIWAEVPLLTSLTPHCIVKYTPFTIQMSGYCHFTIVMYISQRMNLTSKLFSVRELLAFQFDFFFTNFQRPQLNDIVFTDRWGNLWRNSSLKIWVRDRTQTWKLYFRKIVVQVQSKPV